MKKGILIAIIAIGVVIISLVSWYFMSIGKVSKNNEEIKIEIPLGTGNSQIAKILKDNELIKNKLAFKIFIKINKVNNFQAGTYYLKKSMNMKEITDMLQTGIMYDPNQLDLTYLEGKNCRWLAKTIAEHTNNSEDDVYRVLEDETYINSLIEKYWFIDDSIKNQNIYYPLEGYLFPDTYSLKNKDTSVEEIIEKMLDRMEDVLDEYKTELENSKYSVHEILTIASIIEMEAMNSADRSNVASVIYNRLNKNMAIQSDVTTYYAFKIDMGERDLYQKEIDTYNAYNTRGPNMEGRLPIGPISSVSKKSIEAAIKPNNTDFLFFVADKDGNLYFSKTNLEHNRIIEELRSKGLWYEYE